VADAQGLRYYSERSICWRLCMPAEQLDNARGELLRAGLLAHQHPLYQVLSLYGHGLAEARGGGLYSLKQIFKQMGGN
jgi:hypothetical protein